MSAPAITIMPGKTLSDAAETMRRYNVNALPVVVKKGALRHHNATGRG